MTGLPVAARFRFDVRPNALAARWARERTQGTGCIDLADSNPTHWGLGSAAALNALAGAVVAAGEYRPEPLGARSARTALAAQFGGHADDYAIASSTSELYGWILTLCCDPGDEIAVPRPGYPLLDALARLHDVRLVPYELRYAHPEGWFLDAGEIESLLARPRMRALVVVAPGNPTGSSLRPGERAAVVAACARAGALLISDEVFRPFTLERPAADSLSGEAGCATVCLDGASKSLGLPQAKIGWARFSGLAASDWPAARARLEFLADSVLSVSGPAQEALPAMLGFRGEASARIRARCEQNLRAARALFESDPSSPYRVRRCDGGWSLLLETPRPTGDEALALAMLDAGVHAYPGYFFDSPERGLFSLSLLPDPEVFATGCRRLRDAVDALR
ncbi:MAG: pyridoxal phosphate-dependent aminotransferase [Microbacteriaceae bacterium]|nr:pyridoxal phosphate-dependent aminotransferase [Microbacteriaceae bacterium]